MERVVIIGGTGNISTSISRLLVEKGYDVTCFNRGVTKLEWLPEGVHTIVGDRWDRPAFEKAMQAEKFDYAIDMLCFDEQDALSDIRAFRGVKQMIYTSTTCVFGVDYDYLPVDENHEKRPFTVYGKNKSIAEEVFLKAYREEGFPITILRPSSTYGNQSGMVGNVGETNLWIDRIRKGKPVLLSGSGSTVHQLLHVDDAALGYVGALGKQHCIGQCYNLVAEGYMEWRDYYKTGMKVLGKEAPMVCVPLEALEKLGYEGRGFTTDIFGYNTIYDHHKVYRDIPEFRPQVSLEDGMRAVIAFADEHGTIPNSDDYPMDDKVCAYMQNIVSLLD